MKNSVAFADAFKGGVVAALVAVIFNNVWAVVCQTQIRVVTELVNLLTITISTIIPLLLAGVFYWWLNTKSNKFESIYKWVIVIITLVSLIGPLQNTLPDGTATPEGFTILTIPMHLIAGACAWFFVPRYS